MSCSAGWRTNRRSTLARRLAGLLPGDLDRVFFSESGSVAVEVAMKMAVQYWLNRGVSAAHAFLAFSGGYHGDTTGAMAVCDPEDGMHALFARLVAAAYRCRSAARRRRAAALDALLAAACATSIAGIIVEPLVQGAGGMRLSRGGGAAPPARGWPTTTSCC